MMATRDIKKGEELGYMIMARRGILDVTHKGNNYDLVTSN
jgi:hypothetical protein